MQPSRNRWRRDMRTSCNRIARVDNRLLRMLRWIMCQTSSSKKCKKIRNNGQAMSILSLKKGCSGSQISMMAATLLLRSKTVNLSLYSYRNQHSRLFRKQTKIKTINKSKGMKKGSNRPRPRRSNRNHQKQKISKDKTPWSMSLFHNINKLQMKKILCR